MSIPKISQSLMKDYVKYLNKQECGLLFKAKYIDKNVETPPSAAMKLGIYFEYLCTGQLPRNGIKPLPETTLKGELTSAYKKVKESAELFKRIMAHYKIKVLEVGTSWKTDDCNGLLDILAEWNGKKCIIDLKYSGLLDNKWDERGWEIESLPTKDNILIQAVHYKKLGIEILGENLDFYFFVFSSTDSADMRIIKAVVDEDRLASHEVAITQVKESIEKTMKWGFKAIPDYTRCKDCPLYDTCQQRAEMPQVIEVHY